MATLLLTAIGTAIGGPIGGSIGALIGQQADRQIFGGGIRQGPRLRELAISTSSYGQPIARHFGRMRVPGSVIWSTDLIESKRKDKGRKGQPSTVAYSYSASFAVALSSTPLARLGRIWADGNLLRGAQGDLKVGGRLRFYSGFGDDPVDPLIAAAKGDAAPAFRDCAYAVFESLELADYGNRIPALSFEIFADGSDNAVSLAGLVPGAAPSAIPLDLPHALGFADEGGALASTLAAIDQVIPLVCTSGPDGLTIASRAAPAGVPVTLPPQLGKSEAGSEEPRHKQRAGTPTRRPAALRYYDDERDYQPGVQRAVGAQKSGRELMIDLPATMSASGARKLATDTANRARWQHETVTWRVGELDPRLNPGCVVRLPASPGLWLIMGWEWHDRGIELELERLAPSASVPQMSDPGESLPPTDLVIPETRLIAMEIPPDANANPATPLIFAAASAENRAWRGAALYALQNNALVDLGETGSRRAIIGTLSEPLAPSPALLFEAGASVAVELVADDLDLSDSDITGLAAGANRMMIGSEVIQFARAVPLGGRVWQLSGLLRGRGGTEQAAAAGHPAQTPAVLLDASLVALDPALAPPLATTRIAAIGINDTDPVIAPLANAGLSRRPLFPVHPRKRIAPDGAALFSWTRRARGQWGWDDAVDVPLVEERELYLAGYGPEPAPNVTWTLSEPSLRLTQAELEALPSVHGPGNLWVKQIGTYGLSPALRIASLS
ncbi:phage tail protein [Porphyrobacter sp. AAP60]|uniref:GTA baseplate fiber-binding domain-containing protein n=1 Tax=Porphyrobacter sp. AAP60 TaxID=1523423 RepID=UPI0006B8C9E7|nr:phage tail protein [Porphyrobacter sp. AAP60]KPF62999.1 hypothetical protein IP79_10545 [Porphyrobacter sp. AAP60]